MKKSDICLFALLTTFSSTVFADETKMSSPYYFEVGSGISMNHTKESSTDSELNSGVVTRKNTPALSAALGYIYSPNMRFDFNVTYIPQWNISENFTPQGVDTNSSYSTKMSSLITSINAYYDAPELAFKDVTPYVMGGIGMSSNKLEDIDFYAQQVKVSTLYGDTRYNFAWNLGAGANYKINEKASVGIGYKFASLGKVKTNGGYKIASINDHIVDVPASDQVTFKNIYTQQVMINLRIKF